MTDNSGEVTLYLDHIRVVLENASAEALKVAAFGIEAQAKVKIMENGQVDTGFMRASVYTVFKDGSNYAEAEGEAEPLALYERELAPEQPLAEGALAGVICGANYAIYQEALQSFLYAGAEEVAGQLGASIEAVYKESIDNES